MFKMQIVNKFIQIVFIIFLTICTVFDIKKKEIPFALIIIGVISSIVISIWQIYEGSLSAVSVGISILPGLFFILLSFCTKEKVGYGDGLILIVSGLVLGFYQCFLGLCISLLFSSVFAMLLLILHKADKNSALAFVPFLTFGMGVSLFV